MSNIRFLTSSKAVISLIAMAPILIDKEGNPPISQ
jgi:hypothetical protein